MKSIFRLVSLICLSLTISLCASTDSSYIEELKENDYFKEYAGETQAITLGKRKCASIDNGGSNSGTSYERIAIKYYCPEYLDTYKILMKGFPTVMLNIVLAPEPNNFRIPIGGIKEYCYGTGGFSDVNEDMYIVLRDADGSRVSQAKFEYSRANHMDELGDGYVDQFFRCEFRFTFYDIDEVDTEYYILELGDRGEFQYSWLGFVSEIHNFKLGEGFGHSCTYDEILFETCFLIEK